MPDQPSLDHLQEIDNLTQRLIALETQAAQSLEEVRAVIQRYDQAHPENGAAHTPRLDAAIQLIEQCLHSDSDAHNQLVAEINAARDTAQARETEYQPT
jgi:hypothetical protein